MSSPDRSPLEERRAAQRAIQVMAEWASSGRTEPAIRRAAQLLDESESDRETAALELITAMITLCGYVLVAYGAETGRTEITVLQDVAARLARGLET